MVRNTGNLPTIVSAFNVTRGQLLVLFTPHGPIARVSVEPTETLTYA